MSNTGELLVILLLLLFLILAVTVVVVFASRVTKGRRSDAGTKRCPYCAERIRAEAVVCRFCNREQAV